LLHSRVFQPPYCYRWAGLITIVATVIAAAVGIVRTASGTEDARAGVPVTTPSPKPPPEPSPAARISPELVWRIATDDRVVALTFDDGPHPRYTGQILDLLAKYHVKATFCMVGSQAVRFPDLVRRVADAGMRLCDHTANHDENIANLPEPAMTREIVDGRDNLVAAAGANVRIPYFRAPGGYWSERLQRVAARNGMRPLSWSIDSHDWRQPGVDRIVAPIIKEVRPGAIVLLHDGGGDREQTVQALTRLLPWFVEKGYRFDFPS
jgi:peptidoglycan/xylan/chitin deacetylase (PgdA/CDA1 family)